MPLSTRAKRTLQSNTTTTGIKAKKRSTNSKSKVPKKKAKVQNLNEQTDREQKANEDKDDRAMRAVMQISREMWKLLRKLSISTWRNY